MSTKFDNVFLRCNLKNDGSIPATGGFAESPDVFSNGIEALADFKNALSTPKSYESQPEDKSAILRDNYCYMRCKNNTTETISAHAQLFYTQATVILWPDMWNPMSLDFKQETVNDILDIKPGGIGVVERPFIWNKPPSISTNNHYCQIGRLFTDKTPNPIPAVGHPIDMSEIVQTNLMFCQRNIAIIDVDPQYTGYYHTIISASKELKKPSKYHLFFYSHDMTGWQVEITCSMTDSVGRKIGLKKTTVVDNDDLYFGQCLLEPGFNAVISVYVYGDVKYPPTKDTRSSVVLEYAVQEDEFSYAKAKQVIDERRSNRIMRNFGINDDRTVALASMGSYNAYFRNPELLKK